jgi:hypothetical protein
MTLKKITSKEVSYSRSFKDFGISFARNLFTDDVSVLTNENAIKQSVKNLVMTVPGEKPFQPLIGSRVSELLFEPLDAFTIDAIREEIEITIKQFEKRVRLNKVDVIPIYENNKISITIVYKIIGIPINESISFVLQRPE